MKGPESAQSLLGGRTPAAFMSQHWQKKPLLIRHAFPEFNGGLSRDRLIALACSDDVESRLVIRERGRFSLAMGPFSQSDFRRLPASGWTLLVQGVNRVDAATDLLLRRFAFVPYARLDDVMISYATPNGGVGPHFDSYDVFLLQGSGRRRWRYGKQKDLTLVPDIEVKILRRFSPRRDAVLAAGDMLYLPPHIAHEGTAVDACLTYSIGFRAATYTEIAQAFIDFLRDDLRLPTGQYADPDARPSDSPARIDPSMLQRVGAALVRIRWDSRDVGRFLGRFLSEPKPIVRFSPPGGPVGKSTFAAKAASRGLALDRATQLLYDDAAFYVNGEAVTYRGAGTAMLRRLANRRALSARECRSLGASLAALLYQWYRYGFVHLSA
ncbi:MAG TPA: cupin domain-containing protein [Casimicrobiaceae bacterium]|nr:cupin domain-containing protein [Casimicrobiaceae bacterium]